MENEKSGDKPKRNLTLTGVIAWILGVGSLLAGFTYISTNIVAGLLYFLLAIVLIPPIIKIVEDKINFSLSRGLKIVIVLILLTLIGTNIGTSGSSPASSVSNNGTSSTNTETTPKEYVEVFTFSGNGTKKSEPFVITGDRFKIAYNCTGGLCSASLYEVGSKFMSDLIMNTTESINDETTLYGSGEYYIDAMTMGNFSMTVYDYK